MKRVVGWSLLFIVIYSSAMVVKLPAQYSYQQLLPMAGVMPPPQLRLENITGTLWQGAVQQLTWQQQRYGAAEWDMSWLRLFTAQLAAAWRWLPDRQSYLQGFASVDSSQLIALSEVNGDLQAKEIMRFMPFVPVVLGGVLQPELQQAQFTATDILQLDGTIRWSNAAIEAPAAMQLGNITAVITTDEQTVVTALISNDKGDLAINGTVVLTPDKLLQWTIVLQPRDSNNRTIGSTLSMLGRADNEGKVTVTATKRLLWGW